MPTSKSSSIEELLPETEDSGADHYVPSGPGRKRGTTNKTSKLPHGSQAWRRLEDRLNEKRLRHKLREIFDED
ncbi:MAG: hypothetical protein ACRETQ_01080 [Gammaproteobacteria bacterium]